MPDSSTISPAGAVPESFSPDAIRARLSALRARIDRAGGDLSRVKILAVTKTFPVAAIRAALEVGICEFGENYADELVEKAAQLRDVENLRWHFIGAIQRNKLARLAPLTSVYEAVTRIEEGRDIARRTPGARVFVEVDATAVPGRPGVRVDAVPQLVQGLRALELDVAGLMTVAAPGGGDQASSSFATVAKLREDLGLEVCSMGMSEDLELAVAAGSTEIRVGTALFGPRGDRR